MRLRAIYRASFQRSELTNLAREVDAATRSHLSLNDVVCFVSLTGNQLLFVHGFLPAKDARGGTREVLQSVRLRLKSGTWEPRLLVNYAEAAGLALEGLKRYEHYFEQQNSGGRE